MSFLSKKNVKQLIWHTKETYKKLRPLYLPIKDEISNRLLTKSDKKILLIREAGVRPTHYYEFLRFTEKSFPEVRAHFELRLLNSKINDWSSYQLCVPWIQDPVRERSLRIYRRLKEIEEQCLLNQIPVINPVDCLSNSIKSIAPKLLSGLEARVAKVVAIDDLEAFRKDQSGMEFPFLIRSACGHGGKVWVVENQEDLSKVSLKSDRAAIAVEYIDVKDSEGYFRKYRYLALGDYGVSQHMFACRHWEVRACHMQGMDSDVLKIEESAYANRQDPNHELFQEARKKLGMDFVAFDYSYDDQGRPVIWEANPFPIMCIPAARNRWFKDMFSVRDFTVMAYYYLKQARISIPDNLQECIAKMPSLSGAEL